MGYWGTLVVARPQGLLVDQDGVDGFGYQHWWLRDLGDGWQMLETNGWDDPPDLREPARAMAVSTSHPVFAAYVSDSDCAAICTAVGGEVGPLTHLWDLAGPCGYRHQPRDMPGPVGRDLDDVVAELVAWSGAAGLPVDAARLRVLLGHDRNGHLRDADDLLFELVKALGVAQIGRTLPWAIEVDLAPFHLITSTFGPAAQARSRAAWRPFRRKPEPEQPWEPAAIALEQDLWASLYRTDVDVPALVRRVAQVQAAYEAADPPDDRTPADPEQLFGSLYTDLVDSASRPDFRNELLREARERADSRATVTAPDGPVRAG